jgi:general secretion pathway protein D
MRLRHLAIVFVVSNVLTSPLAAQPDQPRQAPPQARPPAAQATPPVAEPQAEPPPASPAFLAAQRRRDEQSVELDELLTRVAETTGKKFFVDPRVRLRVYGVPKVVSPTYAELLSILRIHGFVAVEIGGHVNIVPDANARFLPVRLVQRDDDSVPDDEIVTRVVNARNAARLIPVLRPLMPPSAHLAAVEGDDGDVGKVILMDTYANVRRMTELIDTLGR